MFLKNKKILITGGLGFIGSHLAKKCLEGDAKVTIIDNLIKNCGGNLKNISSIKNKLKINFSDINDTIALESLIKNKDYVFSFAGQSSHIDSMNQPFIDLSVNVSAQLSLLEVCRRINPKIKIYKWIFNLSKIKLKFVSPSPGITVSNGVLILSLI